MQITTISFFKFTSLPNKFWGLKMMQSANKYLANTEGLSFYRLWGSGKGKGFNPLPDWSVYSLLQVWDSEKDAHSFFNSSELSSKTLSSFFITTTLLWLCLGNMFLHGVKHQ